MSSEIDKFLFTVLFYESNPEIIMQRYPSMEERSRHHNLPLVPSPPCSSFSVEIEEMRKSVCRNDSDAGYHTPTSPKHQISASMECPPAPKKPKGRRKKKFGGNKRRLRFVEDDEFVELMCQPKKKKRIEEGETDY